MVVRYIFVMLFTYTAKSHHNRLSGYFLLLLICKLMQFRPFLDKNCTTNYHKNNLIRLKSRTGFWTHQPWHTIHTILSSILHVLTLHSPWIPGMPYLSNQSVIWSQCRALGVVPGEGMSI